MHPNEFDKALRDRYDSGSLPPDLAQWEQLASRLDDYESAAMLPPVTKPRRGLVALWPVWTVAASILLVGWLFLQRTREPELVKHTKHTTTPEATAPAAPIAIHQDSSLAPSTETTNPAAGTRIAQPSNEMLVGKKSLQATETRQRALLPRTAVNPANKPQPPAIAQAPVDASPGSNLPAQLPKAPANEETPQRNISFATREPLDGMAMAGDDFDGKDDERRRLGVDLNGGYGPGSLKRNYALGVSVNRKISKKIRVEAGVAVVSGSYEAFNTAMSNAFRPGVAAVPENSTNRLTYLQAAPGLTYEVIPGLFAGAGVDAQRLLTSSAEAKGYSYSGDELEAQPSWDFGYTMRAGYRVNRHIKAGLQYRNSMHGTAPASGTNVQPRNYLLFQLGYTIH